MTEKDKTHCLFIKHPDRLNCYKTKYKSKTNLTWIVYNAWTAKLIIKSSWGHHSIYFVIYLEFESNLKKIEKINVNVILKKSEKYQDHTEY